MSEDRIKKQIDRALSESQKIAKTYHLTYGEIKVLWKSYLNNRSLDDLYEMLSNSYDYGLVRGMRAEKARQRKIANIRPATTQER